MVLEIDVDGKTRRDHAFFVVRPQVGAPTAPILLALATNTWHAYNDFGGRNLYTGGTTVSLQRPMARGLPPQAAGRRPPRHDRRTRPTRRWPRTSATCASTTCRRTPGRRAGPTGSCRSCSGPSARATRIDVVTNADLEDHPRLLVDGYRLLLSVGHDEYWSSPMRDTVEAFIAGGGNVAFFSGNTSFWQVRFEDPTPEGPAADDGRLQGPLQERPGVRHRPRRRAHEHLVRPPASAGPRTT